MMYGSPCMELDASICWPGLMMMVFNVEKNKGLLSISKVLFKKHQTSRSLKCVVIKCIWMYVYMCTCVSIYVCTCTQGFVVVINMQLDFLVHPLSSEYRPETNFFIT